MSQANFCFNSFCGSVHSSVVMYSKLPPLLAKLRDVFRLTLTAKTAHLRFTSAMHVAFRCGSSLLLFKYLMLHSSCISIFSTSCCSKPESFVFQMLHIITFPFMKLSSMCLTENLKILYMCVPSAVIASHISLEVPSSGFLLYFRAISCKLYMTASV